MQNAMKIKGFLASSFFFGFICAFANQELTLSNQDINEIIFDGTHQTVIELNPQTLSNMNYNKPLSLEMLTNTKVVSLMKIAYLPPKLIERAERVEAMIERGLSEEKDYSEGIKSFKNSALAKDLTMNDVPVLDQGSYGTCVTFATTAALDAVLKRGDFIDQQCFLAHNLFLGNDYWRGAKNVAQIIKPLQRYGIVQKNKCSQTYPARSLKIKTDDYKKLAHPEITLANVEYINDHVIKIEDVRQAIDSGKHMSLGFLLKGNSDPISSAGFDVRVDGERRRGGLWACTQPIGPKKPDLIKKPAMSKSYCGYSHAGHQVVITGYDDEQKLLKIRNSWGERAGDKGDFYMTYEFFNAMNLDGAEIWSKTETADTEMDAETDADKVPDAEPTIE